MSGPLTIPRILYQVSIHNTNALVAATFRRVARRSRSLEAPCSPRPTEPITRTLFAPMGGSNTEHVLPNRWKGDRSAAFHVSIRNT